MFLLYGSEVRASGQEYGRKDNPILEKSNSRCEPYNWVGEMVLQYVQLSSGIIQVSG